MNVVFRTDASLSIGSGHLTRCLTLAQALHDAGARCHFVGRSGAGDLLEFVRARGFATYALPPAAAHEAPGTALAGADAEATRAIASALRPDWLVVDHYGIDHRWESSLRPACARLLVIDDLADRVHDCDLLLDQNVYADATDRYAGLVPAHCKVLIGAAHALLRPEFAAAHASALPRVPGARPTLHVFFGGSDPTGDTLRTLGCLADPAFAALNIEVVLGMQNPQRGEVLARAAEMTNVEVAVQVTDIARRLQGADLAVGACGSAALERCCLGVPTLTLVTADNQRQLAAGLAHHGAILPLGPSADLRDATLAQALVDALERPDLLRRVARAGLALFPDGAGGAGRLAASMMNMDAAWAA